MKLLTPFALFTLMTLTACAHRNTSPTAGESLNVIKLNQAFENNITQVLSFYEQYSNLGHDAQKKVFFESSQALSTNKNHLLHRVKMATMLAIPTSHLRDQAKAQSLLQELMRDQTVSGDVLAYVGLLYEFSLDTAKQQQKLKDTAKQSDTLEQKYETLQKKHEALEQKNNALEQKLIDLKNIEKSLNGR